LKVGGRAVISDIVCDEDVPLEMQEDAELWSGCISGAFREDDFLQAFEDAGFYGVQILKLDKEPWRTVKGIEFRSMTIEATKGSDDTCLERHQAVIYKGPFKSITDDDGHTMVRGRRYAVCDRTYRTYKSGPFADAFEFIDPRVEVPMSDAEVYDCSVTALRPAAVTKGAVYDATTEASDCCEPSGGCC
ncbi:MAG: arsenite methyltransferase, partial [Pseudoalteromonas tetraodonis]